jgi:hypothetical protein
LIINYLLTSQKKCGRYEVAHCSVCDYDLEICTKCEDNYFVLYGGTECVKCDDKDFGQPQCDGKCDDSRYDEIGKVLCDNCKEGFYSIEGICFSCESGSEKCVKCSYKASPGSDKKIYTCLDCLGGLYGEYRVSKNDGKCRVCNKPPCSECHYKNGTIDDYFCTKCPKDYFLSNERCHQCYYNRNDITGGYCKKYYCPGDSNHNNNYCYCNSYYVLSSQNTCLPYPSNCKSAHYDQNTNSAFCDKCDDNYVVTNLGTCTPYPSYCKSAHYDQNTNSAFCDKCYSNYVVTNLGTCTPYPSYCNLAHYDQTTNSAFCDKCISNYVVTNLGICTPCPSNCYSCHYNQTSNTAICDSCHSYYAITNQGTCISCPSSPCNSCFYDQNTNSAICNSCNSGYILGSDHKCIYCGAGCQSCKLEEGNITCTSCYSNYLWNGAICEQMSTPSYCSTYKREKFNNKNEFVCTSCYSNYALNKIDNKCVHCPNYCPSCLFDDINTLVCNNCVLNYVLNETKLCEFCTSNEAIGGVGCLQCKYENGINKCTDCRNDYIHIDNEYVCKLPSEVNLHVGCRNATRLENGEYTCNRCRSISYTMMIRYNNTNDCYPAEKELVYCQKGYEDENKTLSCTNCLYNYRYIWSDDYQINVCDNHCASDYFFNYDEDIMGCYKCDDESGGGQIGCNPKKGCSFIAADNHIYCNSCKTGYFRYDWQCLTCSVRDSNCIECDFNNTENKFKCKKCVNNTFYVNNETGLCEIITYNEYPEVTPGCILPINNYTTYIKNKKCFDCKYGFFKTKEESCIYCKARKNGGPKCDKCQYIKDKNGNEINKINCKDCQEDNMISPIGRKCYNCEDEVGPGCKKCIFEEGTERVICETCNDGYEKNGAGYCTKKYSYDKLIPNCLIYEDNKSNSLRLLAVAVKCKKCYAGY